MGMVAFRSTLANITASIGWPFAVGSLPGAACLRLDPVVGPIASPVGGPVKGGFAASSIVGLAIMK